MSEQISEAADIEQDDEAGSKARPVSTLDEEDLLRRLKMWERQARQHSSTWRKDARMWYDLVSGEQWEERDKVALLDTMRQPIVFNRIAPTIDAVAGAEILNRQDVSYFPRKVGKVQAAEIFGAADDWARQQCDAEDEESDTFTDAIICGMGWTETRMDYADNPEGMISIGRVDPMEMWWDPNAKKRNITDRRYHYRRKGFDRDEFKMMFPGKYEQVLSANNSPDGNDDMGEDFRPPFDKYRDGTGNDNEGSGGKLVFVEHWQWWEMEDGFTVQVPPNEANPMGGVKSMSADEYKPLVMQSLMQGQQPPQAMKSQRKAYYECFKTGNVIVREPRRLDCQCFTFHCVTGKRDRNKNTWYGIVKALNDPQKWANKWLSQILHIINTNAKGGLIYEEGVFKNPTKAMQEWARPDSLTEVARGGLERLKEKPPGQFPNGHEKLLEFAITSMPQISGVNMELLGLVERDQPGVLEQQRKKSGYAILAVYFDSLRRYRKLQGRTMLHYIQNYISDGRLVKIVGGDGLEQYVPLVRQHDSVEYDVVVDEAPMSQNQKDAVWGMLIQMMPMLQKQPIPGQVWAELLKYSPLPSTISSKISQALTQPNPQQDQAAQLEMAKKSAEVKKDESTAMLNMARAHKQGMPDPQQPQAPGADPYAEQMSAQADVVKAHSDAKLKEAQTIAAFAKARKDDMETQLMPFETQIRNTQTNRPQSRPSV